MWIWCLLRATYKDRQVVINGQVIDLKPGEFVTGRYSASEELKLNPNTFRKRLKILEELKMIESKSTNKYTVISVINWASYQLSAEQSTNKTPTEHQQSTNKAPTEHQQSTTNNKEKKVNKVKKENKEPINKHGEYGHVLLTEIQLSKLIADFGQEKINEYIKRVDEYCQQHAKKYNDCNLTIRNWLSKEVANGGHPKSNSSPYNFDSEAI